MEFESGGGMGGFSDFFKNVLRGGVDLDDLFGQAGSGFRGGRRGSDEGLGAQRGFGGHGQAPPTRAGTDVSGELTITLDEAYHGTTKRLSIEGDSGVESIDVRIPPGVKAGSKIRVSGKGERLQGSSAGDLYLSVRMQAHPVYKTKDDDLYVDVPVTFAEAALGAEIEVPTLSGKSRVKVPAGSQAGRLLRLRGKGMPHLKGDGHGDLFAKLLIVVPKELSQRERELMKELSEIRGENPRAHPRLLVAGARSLFVRSLAALLARPLTAHFCGGQPFEGAPQHLIPSKQSECGRLGRALSSLQRA